MKLLMNKRIVIIGAGNVAYHLAPAILKAGFNLCQIYSRHIESAKDLGMKIGIAFTNKSDAVFPDADIYIFCISDDAILSVFKELRINKNALVIHTSGSMPMNIFEGLTKNYGVLYPLQTFSKKRALVFNEIPLCIEASNVTAKKELREIATKLSQYVEEVSSEKRKTLHIAAVFACNFVNHLYDIAFEILQKDSLDFSLLRPLISETANKVMTLLPADVQTGPAVRGDKSVLAKHKEFLKEDKKWNELYCLFSDDLLRNSEK
ncbi:hypothetical protein FACS1894195_2210 [Bacteroidia bacterium]|nr:hypothetical protein FACS1894195_2210 [Bacteroidia bacterium]